MQISNSAVNDYISNILPVSPSRVSVRAKTLIKKKIEKLASASTSMKDNSNLFSNGEWVFQIDWGNNLPQIVSVSRFEKSWGTSLTKTASKGLGWSYIRLPLEVKRGMKKIRDMIDPKDIGEDGKESNPHVTVKYGLVTKDPEEVKKAVEHNKGGKVRMGKTSVFKNDDADVLKVSVTSSSLGKLWDSLSTLKNEDRFDKYIAHATLAYLKPGTGDKYVGIDVVDGKEFTFDSFVFEDANDVKTEIKLEDSKISKKAQTEIDDFSDLGFGDFEISDANSFSGQPKVLKFKDPADMLKNNVPTTGSESYMIECKTEQGWIYSGYLKYDSGIGYLQKVFASPELAMEAINHIYYRAGFPLENFRIVQCNFAIKFREDSNTEWEDAETLRGRYFSTQDMAIDYFRDFYYTNEPKYGEFSVEPQRIENRIIIGPEIHTEDNPYYTIEYNYGNGWDYFGYHANPNSEDNELTFKTEESARQAIGTYIPTGFEASELRVSPCEFIIKTRSRNLNVSWEESSSMRIANSNVRFFDPIDAHTFIREAGWINDYPNLEFKVFPIRLKNTQASSTHELSKTSETNETTETIKLNSKVVDNYIRENLDVELSFTNTIVKHIEQNPILAEKPKITIGGRWSWYLSDLMKNHSDKLYLDHGAGWYVEGMLPVLREAVDTISNIRHGKKIPDSIETQQKTTVKIPEELGPIDDFSDLVSNFDFSISGSAKQPVKIARANHLILGLNSEAIDGSGNLYDAHLIIEEKSIKNSYDIYDITTIPKIRLTLGKKSYTWKLLDQIAYGSDTICVNSATRVCVSGIIDILKEAKRIFEDRTGIRMPEIIPSQQNRTQTTLIPKTDTKPIEKPIENPVDDFSDLFNDFDFNITSGL